MTFFAAISKLFVFANFLFLLVILRPTSEISKENFCIVLLLLSCFVICFTDYLN